MKLRTPLAAAVLVSSIASCGPGAPSPELVQLREQLAAARADAELDRLASRALDDAVRAGDEADSLWGAGASGEEVDHAVYVARQRLELARLRAAGRAAEERRAEATAERDRLRAEQRMREADRARAEAEALMRSAAEARAAAEQRALAERLAREEAERRAQLAMEERDLALEAAARDRALAAELAELNAQATERGLVLTLGDVLFDLNRAELKDGSKVNLERLVQFLGEHEDRNVLIEGHTDSTGGLDYNMKLSEERAESVSNFLVEQGVDPERIALRGLGPSYPLVSNETAEGRQRNRRVEIVILREGQATEGQLRELPEPAGGEGLAADPVAAEP